MLEKRYKQGRKELQGVGDSAGPKRYGTIGCFGLILSHWRKQLYPGNIEWQLTKMSALIKNSLLDYYPHRRQP